MAYAMWRGLSGRERRLNMSAPNIEQTRNRQPSRFIVGGVAAREAAFDSES